MSWRISALILVSSMMVGAHRPLLKDSQASCDGDFGSSSAALTIPDATISWSMSHYADCTKRSLWFNFVNPAKDFLFYVGSGIPVKERFSSLRVDAVILGPDLPALTPEMLALIPEEVRSDPVFQIAGIGGLLHQSPADQSNCDHLGTQMDKASKVINGRCDFWEEYGRTNSWRVLDADGNKIPTKGETYHVAVWLKENTSGKFGVAVGTWKEDFRTPFDLATPTCERNFKDFSEQHLEVNADCAPVVQCPTSTPISKTTCPARDDACGVGEKTVVEDDASAGAMTMACGGEQCPTALSLWEAANLKMHHSMALNFTGDSSLDFVRGMMPHHAGALDMCEVLVKLECVALEDVGALEGMVHFCNHVQREQIREIAGMKQWLAEHGHAEEAKCAEEKVPMDHSDHGSTDHSDHGGTDHSDHGGGRARRMGGMYMGCGNLEAAKPYIDANMDMHSSMAVSLTCSHTVDFVRAMIPHHKGAIAMCDILVGGSERRARRTEGETDHGETDHGESVHSDHSAPAPDAYLLELCVNITRVQRAEVAWMSRWLTLRDHAVHAPCGISADGTCTGSDGVKPFGGVEPALPCENTLPTSSFCHALDGTVSDTYCTCERAAETHACGTTVEVDGLATLEMDVECARFCGLCPDTKRPPLFPAACPAGTGVAYTPTPTVALPVGCSGFGAQNGCDGAAVCCSGTCRLSECAAWEVLGAGADGAAAGSAAAAAHTSLAAVAVAVLALW